MSDYIQFKGNNPFGSQAKMLYHIDRIHEYLETGDTKPIFVEFNLTDVCNMRCEWCISANCHEQRATIDKEVAKKFLRDFKSFGGKAVTFSGGGEPTCHPDFIEILTEAYNIGLDIGLMTNGAFDHDYCSHIGEKCKWVRISLDTLDATKYKKWKGVDHLQRVKKNIAMLVMYQAKVGINCNVSLEHSWDDVDKLVQLTPHVDYLQFRPVLPRYFKGELPEINHKVFSYLSNFANPKINMSDDKFKDLYENNLFPFTSCEGHFFNPVVQANGDVTVCMYHPGDSRFVFGNLYERDFKKIWKSQQRKKVIKELCKIKYCDECQVCCKLTELNKFIDFLKYPSKEMDINFL